MRKGRRPAARFREWRVIGPSASAPRGDADPLCPGMGVNPRDQEALGIGEAREFGKVTEERSIQGEAPAAFLEVNGRSFPGAGRLQ